MPGRARSAAARERRRVAAPIALCAGLAWLLLALGSLDIFVPALCTGELLWSVPSRDLLAFVLAVNSPARLALGWAVMVAAMMLPTLGDLLVHVRQRSFARARAGCVAALLSGFAAVWMLAGIVLMGLALAVQLSAPGWRVALLQVLALALVWQVSPIKQLALNRCHGRPVFAAFGHAAWRDCFVIGLRAGGWCFASCWAVMLVALVVPAGHLAVMAAVALLIWAERLEPPRLVR
jgi:predicted metal-binding membrane protein